MATYYWVGGSGMWNDGTGNNWSNVSGGPSYASNPTVAAALGNNPDPTPSDDVVFDSNSSGGSNFTVDVLINNGSIPISCANLTIGGLSQTLTMTGSSGLITGGNVTFDATTQINLVLFVTLYLTGTCSLTTGGFSNFNNSPALVIGYTPNGYDAISGTVILDSDLGTAANPIPIAITDAMFAGSASSLNTNGYTIRTSGVSLQGFAGFFGTTPTIDYSTSNVYYYNSPTVDFLANPDIIYTTTNANFYLVGNPGSPSSFTAGTVGGLYPNEGGLQDQIQINVTSCGVLDIKAPTNPGAVTVYGTMIVANEFRTSGTAGNRRVSLGDASNSFYLNVMNVTTFAISDLDVINGVVDFTTPITGTRIGSLGTISGIVPSTPKTVYWNGTGNKNWTDNVWAASSGGTPDTIYFPLIQDSVIIGNTGAPSTISVGTTANYVSGFSCAGLTSPVTVNGGGIGGLLILYGDVTLSSAITMSLPLYLEKVNSVSGTFNVNGASFYAGAVYMNRSYSLSSSVNFGEIPFSFSVAGTGNDTLTLNNYTLTVGLFTASSGILINTIEFGTSSQIVLLTGVLTVNDGTSMTGTIKIVNDVSSNRYVYVGVGVQPELPVSATGTTGIILGTSNSGNVGLLGYFDSIDLTGYTGELQNNGVIFCYGNFTLGTGHTMGPGTWSFYFAVKAFSSNITSTINFNGKVFPATITIGYSNQVPPPASTKRLISGITTTSGIQHNSGTFDLNGYDITCAYYYSTGNRNRQIQFGSNQINLTGNNTAIYNVGGTGFSYTGTFKFVSTYTGSTGTRGFTGGLIGTNEYANFRPSGTSGVIFGTAADDTVQPSGIFNDIDFTGYPKKANLTNVSLLGNLTVVSGMTLTSSVNSGIGFITSSGTKTITTNGVSLPVILTFTNTNSPGGSGTTWQLADNLTITTTAIDGIRFAAGTLNFNGYNVSATGLRVDGTNNKTINLGSGTLTLTGASPVSTLGGTVTNLTTTWTTGYINLTSTATKTFVGSGFSWPRVNIAGTGQITFSGNNTFDNLTNSVQPITVRFTAGATQTFNSFGLLGIAGSLVTINSSSTSQTTLRKSSPWLMGANSTNSGNNTGLTFAGGGGIDYLNVSYINGQVITAPSSGNFFMLF